MKITLTLAKADVGGIGGHIKPGSRLMTRTGEPCVAVSTTRLHNIAGKYTVKDDPVMMVRVQGPFFATGEVLQPFKIGHFVAGSMRGSHVGPLMFSIIPSGTTWETR